MLPKKHFFLGLIFSGILFLIFKISIFEAGIIFLASTLIDVDHYFYYIFKTKNFGLKRAYNWYREKEKRFSKLSKNERKKYLTGFCWFHGLETLIISGVLGFFISPYFYFILIGAGFHLILDYIHWFDNFHYPLKISIIYDFFVFGKLKSF